MSWLGCDFMSEVIFIVEEDPDGGYVAKGLGVDIFTQGDSKIELDANVREAVALGDRVLVFSPRPGRLVGEFSIDLPRPRSFEDPALILKTREIMAVLRSALANRPEEEPA